MEPACCILAWVSMAQGIRTERTNAWQGLQLADDGKAGVACAAGAGLDLERLLSMLAPAI